MVVAPFRAPQDFRKNPLTRIRAHVHQTAIDTYLVFLRYHSIWCENTIYVCIIIIVATIIWYGMVRTSHQNRNIVAIVFGLAANHQERGTVMPDVVLFPIDFQPLTKTLANATLFTVTQHVQLHVGFVFDYSRTVKMTLIELSRD